MTTIAKIHSSELRSQKKRCDLSASMSYLSHLTYLRLPLLVYQDFKGQGCQDLTADISHCILIYILL